MKKETGMVGDYRDGQYRGPALERLEPRLLLDGTPGAEAMQLFDLSPALFVENQGQWADESIRYAFQGDTANVLFTDTGPVFQMFAPSQQGRDGEDDATRATQFSAHFDGATSTSPVGLERSDTTFNYLLGERSSWRSGVSAYRIVAYESLYDGIDLLTWGRKDGLKYEFHVGPGADYTQIRISYDGIQRMFIARDGSLHVETQLGELIDDAPYIYQDIDGARIEVAGGFQLVDSDTYTFAITGPYDSARELILDPDLAWATYWGSDGGDSDYGRGIALDSAGNAYVTGTTLSSDWATPGAYDTTYGGWSDAFVAKLNPSGTELLYCTFLGGSGRDSGDGIGVDSAGNAYVTGETESAGIATPGAYDTTLEGSSGFFAAKLNPDGSDLVYWTYLDAGGGSIAVDPAGNAYVTGGEFVAKINPVGSDLVYYMDLPDATGEGIALDQEGNAYVTGDTGSSELATPGAYDTTLEDGRDGFVTKINAEGSDLVYFTYLGGADSESGSSIAVDLAGNAYVTGGKFVAKINPDGSDLVYRTYLDAIGQGIGVDAAGNAYVTGRTTTAGLATPGAYDTTYDISPNGDFDDAFVAKLSPTGGELLYFTYLGGARDDPAAAIAVDAAGHAYVIGMSENAGLATPGAYDTVHNGEYDAFVAKLNTDGSDLDYYTYLGEGGIEWGYAIAVNDDGNAYITGQTTSGTLATPGTASEYNGGYDAFVAKLSSDGSDLVYCTYLGGSEWDIGYGIAVDSTGSAYVTGLTGSAGWATPGAYDTTFDGPQPDVFVAKLSPDGSDLLYSTYLGGGGDREDWGEGIAVDSTGNAYVTGWTQSAGLATPGVYDTTYNDWGDAFVAKLNSDGSDLVYFTYLGGGGRDHGYAIAVDASDSAYVTGRTFSSDWATPGAYDTTYNGGYGDVFVAKLNSDGSDLVYCTYLGGEGYDYGYAIAVDASDSAYVTGTGFVAKLNPDGSDLVYHRDLPGTGHGIAVDASDGAYVTGIGLVAKLNPDGSDLVYYRDLPGTGSGIAVDSSGSVYVVGTTDIPGWATPGAYDTTLTDFIDAFVAKMLIRFVGDVDLSGNVNVDDLDLLLDDWGTGTEWGQGDLNDDHTVDDDDLSLLLANWGDGATPLLNDDANPGGSDDGNSSSSGDDGGLSLLLANWDTGIAPPLNDDANSGGSGDGNSSSSVDDDDLSLLLSNWNRGTPPPPVGQPAPPMDALQPSATVRALTRAAPLDSVRTRWADDHQDSPEHADVPAVSRGPRRVFLQKVQRGTPLRLAGPTVVGEYSDVSADLGNLTPSARGRVLTLGAVGHPARTFLQTVAGGTLTGAKLSPNTASNKFMHQRVIVR